MMSWINLFPTKSPPRGIIWFSKTLRCQCQKKQRLYNKATKKSFTEFVAMMPLNVTVEVLDNHVVQLSLEKRTHIKSYGCWPSAIAIGRSTWRLLHEGNSDCGPINYTIVNASGSKQATSTGEHPDIYRQSLPQINIVNIPQTFRWMKVSRESINKETKSDCSAHWQNKWKDMDRRNWITQCSLHKTD